MVSAELALRNGAGKSSIPHSTMPNEHRSDRWSSGSPGPAPCARSSGRP